jgi:hypothetical protein
VNKVGPASFVPQDSEPVHQKQYARLVELAVRVQKQGITAGATLWGEAGIGKSHLLARLAKWADKQGVFVYLSNLQTAPEHLPRTLLRNVVSILTRGREDCLHETPLYRVVNAALRQALEDDGSRKYSWDEANTAYRRLIDSLCDGSVATAGVVDRQTYTVLFRFYQSAHHERHTGATDGIATLAARWLGGDVLDTEEARKLGVQAAGRGGEGVALADDEQIKKVLVALARVASYRGRPLILCFDQVDNLDPEQFSSLSSFLHALLDAATNLLVITSGVRATLMRWESEGVFGKSTWDRLGQYAIELQRVSLAEARQIVQARLQPFQESFTALEPVNALLKVDYLFPLGEKWSRKYLGDQIDFRPRDVINWANEGWRAEQAQLQEHGGERWLAEWSAEKPKDGTDPSTPAPPVEELIDKKVSLKMQEHLGQRRLEPHTLPPDGDNLAGLLQKTLERCLNAAGDASLLAVEQQQKPKYGQRPPLDLILRQRFGDTEIRTGLVCVIVGNRNSMSAYLRRLTKIAQPPERLFLVTDERRPLDPAATGQEYLELLGQRLGDGFRQVQLTFDQYAELDALQATVGLARSGDLEIELPGGNQRRVSEAEVVASHHRQGRYLAHPLLLVLLTPTGTQPPVPPPAKPSPNGAAPPDKLSEAEEQDLRQFLMGRLGITMGSSSRELAIQYRDYLQNKKIVLDADTCKGRIEESARRLHAEGLLQATPHDDFLYILMK